mgnify:CR=1 FL=1
MKKLLAVWVLLLAAVSANAADKKCPGTVHFLDGRTLECTSITIPGWIDAEVSVRVLSDGKNQARTLAAVEIAYLELWPEKNPETQKRTLLRPVHQGKREKEDSGSPMAGTGIFGQACRLLYPLSDLQNV